MAENDSLFDLDVVRDFILSKGGKTTNHELVSHFKTFLNNPKWKNQNRQKFKEIVNTLATVKLDESGEKVLVLKAKYRDGTAMAGRQQPVESPCSLLQNVPRQRPKAKKAKLAEQFEVSASETPLPASKSFPDRSTLDDRSHSDTATQDTFTTSYSFSDTTSLNALAAGSQSGVDTGPSLSDMLAGELGSLIAGSSLESSSAPEEINEPLPEVASGSTPDADQAMSSTEAEYGEPKPALPMVEEDMAPEEPPTIVIQEDAGASAASGGSDVGDDTEHGMAEGSVRDAAGATDNEGVSVAGSDDYSMMETPAPNRKLSEDVIEEGAVSVKARAQHLNKMESLSSLDCTTTTKKLEQSPKAAVVEEEDSESAMTISITDVERKWMVDASRCDYQELAKSLNNNPKLARFKDFITGYTALHWAAKQGNSNVIKLLCGSKDGVNVNAQTHGGYTALHLASIQGHEDIIELLVQGYHADPDIRDHSGRKPKQYLKHAASTRSQQLLQPKRIHTSAVTSTSQTAFRRKGSYSSKIRTLGETPFGIQGGVAMRKSWAAPSVGLMRSATPSPDMSPRPSPGPIRRLKSDKDQEIMPPPQGVPITRQKTRKHTSRENLSDSELPVPSLPLRTHSDTNLVIQTETGV